MLPEELVEGSPSGFAATGHLGRFTKLVRRPPLTILAAHVNLKDEYLPYKHIIGQVILDVSSAPVEPRTCAHSPQKNTKVRTVVNKLDSIDTQFRFFKMELIAGTPDYIVEHVRRRYLHCACALTRTQRESDCIFTFDFTRVYWNSRLHHEHDRLVQAFAPADVVADVFAGVGPFVLPAAKKGCAVWANDLNPDSYKYLCLNVAQNAVADRVTPSCDDGRAFIRTIARRAFDRPFPAWEGPKPSKTQQRSEKRQRMEGKAAGSVPDQAPAISAAPALPPRRTIAHFVMNLPDSAITFLDEFRGILAAEDLREAYKDKLPMVHCHCFTRELEPQRAEADIRAVSLGSLVVGTVPSLNIAQRVEERLGHVLTDEVSAYWVRSVAPNKEMYCISFRLPAEVAFA
jgi:tRNA (guanine37-N1)-methyltransferase